LSDLICGAMIQFTKTEKVVKNGWPDIRNTKMSWRNTSLRMEYSYEEGYITTPKGSKVIAYEYIKDSLNVELFDKSTKQKIDKPPSYFEQFNFDLSYNCFGYCFAESKVFLPDPTKFLEEEYEQVDSEEAELILFKQFMGFGDHGEEIFVFSHGAKVLPNGNVSFKPGINALIEDVDRRYAIFTYNLNHEVCYRKKTNLASKNRNKMAENEWLNIVEHKSLMA